MSTMVCSNCGRYGIYWKNLSGLYPIRPYTYCPNCSGTNCQKPEEPHFEEAEDGEEETL